MKNALQLILGFLVISGCHSKNNKTEMLNPDHTFKVISATDSTSFYNGIMEKQFSARQALSVTTTLMIKLIYNGAMKNTCASDIQMEVIPGPI